MKMMKLSKRNKKIFNSVLLGFYFLFLVSAIFHSHTIDFSSQLEVSDYTTSSKIVDPFLDSKANCSLAQFFQSQLVRCDSSNNLKFIVPIVQLTSPHYNSRKVDSPFLISLKLRAPPQLLS